MKLLATAIATLSIAVVTPALAGHAYGLNDAPSGSGAYGGTSDGSYANGAGGKTRADVYAELVQAQRDGIVPSNKSDYPPSQRTIDRNRELYRARH